MEKKRYNTTEPYGNSSWKYQKTNPYRKNETEKTERKLFLGNL